jgi:hypothetical protein
MLTLTALHLIESGFARINARGDNSYLRDICITYPAGWTFSELESYRECWQLAINIFTLNNLKQSDPHPHLRLELDETLATQLPIIYDGVLNQNGNVDSWFDLYGKIDKTDKTDANGKKSIRILTYDIGGGTGDFAVVEYSKPANAASQKLTYKLLFRDSSYSAGDVVVKRIIENILLPKLRRTGLDLDKFKQFWRNTNTARLSYLTRRFLLPLVNEILKTVSEGRENPAPVVDSKVLILLKTWYRDATAEDFFTGNDEQVLTNVLKAIVCGDGKLDVEKQFKEVISEDIKTLAKYTANYDVDLFILSGKPTEMQCVRDLIDDYIPLPQSRRLNITGLRVGRWYPFRDGNDRIADAKNVNLVGLAMESLTRYGNISTISILPEKNQSAQTRHKWIVTDNGKTQKISEPLFTDGEETQTVEIRNGQRICRYFSDEQIVPTYSPVYQFFGIMVGEEGQKMPADTAYSVSLNMADNGAITLDPASVKPIVGTYSSEQIETVELRLSMLETDDFWMDKPSFEVNFE